MAQPDQTSTLRQMAAARAEQQDTDAIGSETTPPRRNGTARRRVTHVLSVTSGKGGVGKTCFVINVAIALSERHKKVLVLDADMGLANVDILLGITSRSNLSHVLRDEKTLDEVIVEGPSGIHVLPAASGLEWMVNLTGEQRVTFLQKMDALNGRYDILLLDTGAGISSNVTYFNLAAQTRIVVVTPEPTSLTDAYALIKVLHQSHSVRSFEVVVNSVHGEQEALEVYRSLTTVADRFLDVRLGYLGCIERDDQVRQAVLKQKPVVLLYPEGKVARSYRGIAQRIAQLPVEAMGNELGLFWRTMVEKDHV